MRGFCLIKTKFWFLEFMEYRRYGSLERMGYRHDDDHDEMSAPMQYCTSVAQGKVSG